MSTTYPTRQLALILIVTARYTRCDSDAIAHLHTHSHALVLKVSNISLQKEEGWGRIYILYA